MTKSTLDDKLSFLNRLCSGRSPLICQYNLLVELRSLLHWEQVVLLDFPEPWILPLNERVPFTVPEQPCPTGVWQWAHSDRTLPVQGDSPSRLLQRQSGTLDKIWRDWCRTIAHHYHLPEGALMMIDISLDDAPSLSCQFPIVLLRSDNAFNDTELGTLRVMHDAMQQIVDQAIIIERLVDHSNDEPEILSTCDTLPLPMDDRPEPCIQECLQKLGLTPRQVEVMHLIIKGKEVTAIAQELGCTEATVRKHVENLYRRLGVQTRTAAIAQVLETIGIV